MAFHRKKTAADTLNADVLIVPECARPEVLERNGLQFEKAQIVWAGENPNKGLAVIARSPYRVTPLYDSSDTLPVWAFPVQIQCPSALIVDLIAAWSFWYRDKRNTTGNPVAVATNQFADRLKSDILIVAGDFNNSVIWDRGKSSDHRATSQVLGALGLVSAYHCKHGVEYGEEPASTLFWRDRTIGGPRFHIDYVYVPKRFANRDLTVELGSHEEWIATHLSDHAPIVVEIPTIG